MNVRRRTHGKPSFRTYLTARAIWSTCDMAGVESMIREKYLDLFSSSQIELLTFSTNQ